MHDSEKSDSAIVAVKPPNKAGVPVAEAVERRAGAKGNADQQSTYRTQSRIRVTQALSRVRQADLRGGCPAMGIPTAILGGKRPFAGGGLQRSGRRPPASALRVGYSLPCGLRSAGGKPRDTRRWGRIVYRHSRGTARLNNHFGEEPTPCARAF